MIAEGKASVNVFAFDDSSAGDWERSAALLSFASEARELQASVESPWAWNPHTNNASYGCVAI